MEAVILYEISFLRAQRGGLRHGARDALRELRDAFLFGDAAFTYRRSHAAHLRSLPARRRA